MALSHLIGCPTYSIPTNWEWKIALRSFLWHLTDTGKNMVSDICVAMLPWRQIPAMLDFVSVQFSCAYCRSSGPPFERAHLTTSRSSNTSVLRNLLILLQCDGTTLRLLVLCAWSLLWAKRKYFSQKVNEAAHNRGLFYYMISRSGQKFNIYVYIVFIA
jgi:hypothetical protein